MGHADILLKGDGGAWLAFRSPCAVHVAARADRVESVLRAACDAADRGMHAVGFVSYEAAPAFDAALRVRDPSGEQPPLAWFAVFPSAQPCEGPRRGAAGRRMPAWESELTEAGYARVLDRIRDYLKAGDTYQVNYTWRLRAPFRGDPRAFFDALAGAQDTDYGAYIDTGRHVVCCASPELFFDWDNGRAVSRPMKGTAPRGASWREDAARARALRTSAKTRAENIMIVDMIRNDLGRVARPGSVRAHPLCSVERYPTVLQMTSTVTADGVRDVPSLMRALFPCASVTGAPKVRTMEIVHELEPSPRGVYTGAVGRIGPGRCARFGVAIRTAVVDREKGCAEYGIGSGVVWDSDAASEFAECRVKAAVLTARQPSFELLETMRWTRAEGFWLLEGHLRRLRRSAAYFGFPLDVRAARRRLEAWAARQRGAGVRRVRLLAGRGGKLRIVSRPLEAPAGQPRRVTLARGPVADIADPFLRHKTTHRDIYERALKTAGEADDVILWNRRGEITESTIANVVVEKDGCRYTPPAGSGLLEGVCRAHLIARREVRVKKLYRRDLETADRLFLVNSVRGWMPAVLIGSPPPRRHTRAHG
jgi:para-aminobenzoate synthetase/4-amino-4-deoxychorismate lyase